jgi:hypothetical protein
MLKFAATGAIALAAWAITSRALPPPAIAAQPGHEAAFSKAAADRLPQFPAGVAPKGGARFSWDTMDITPGKGIVEVSAAAEVIDDRDGAPRYKWVALIWDAGHNEILHTIPYDGQVFTAPARGKPYHPSFKDTFATGPGTFDVELRLYGTSQPGGFDEVRPNAPHEGLLLSRFDTVTVRP